jgi:hypothetical protein
VKPLTAARDFPLADFRRDYIYQRFPRHAITTMRERRVTLLRSAPFPRAYSGGHIGWLQAHDMP